MSRGIKIATLMLVIIFLGSIPGVSGQEEIGALGYFGSERIYNSTRSLSGGMGAGDLDGDGETEVAFCDFSGNVVMIDPQPDGSLRALPIWQEEGPQGTDRGLFDLVVADVLDENDGPEILVGGYSGNLYAIYRESDLWTHTIIHTNPMYDDTKKIRIFDIEVADVDPAPGDEILLGSMINDQIDPDRYLRYVYRTGADFDYVEIEVPDAVKAIDVGDADSTRSGDEIYITTSGWNELGGTDSSLVQLHRNGTSWDQQILFRNQENLIANVRLGEFWSGHAGNELITAGLSGWCRVFWESGSVFERKDVFQAQTAAGESSAIEGLAIGDFNPANDGDEAMVTGYYNIVTQVIEVEGEIIAETAWKTEAEDIRLEFAGVEVADVTDRHEGNEVMLANLAGWIEMLYHQEDGLDLILPQEVVEVDVDSTQQFDVEVVPRGSVAGDLVVDITGGDLVDVIYDRFQTLEQGESLKIPVVLDPLSSGERNFRLNVTVTVGGMERSGEVTVRVVPAGGGFSISVQPSTLVLYDKGGNTRTSQITLVGAEAYDQIELSVNQINGLSIMIDSPIRPGDTKNIIVQAEPGFTGSRSITITGSHNGMPIAQASLLVDVLSLSQNLDFQLRKDDSDRYFVRIYLNGSGPVNGMTVAVQLDDEIIYMTTLNMDPDSYVDLPPLALDPGDQGTLKVNATNIANQEIEIMNMGPIDIPDDEDDERSGWEIMVGAVLILIAIIIVALLFIFTKPKARPEDASIESIGGRRKYDYRPHDRDVRRGSLPERRGPPERPGRRPEPRGPPRRPGGPRF